MDRLDRKGYLISIGAWMGRLGNHLIQFTGALNVARKTQSKLTIPHHPLLKRRIYDFRAPANEDCLDPVVGAFLFQSQCFQFPIVYDCDRRALLREFAYDALAKKSPGEWVRTLVTRPANEDVHPDTLVINLRSGHDIFRTDPPPQNDYMQPPLSFYKRIIESHGYEDCLIVTEAERKNPCIDALMAWRRNIRLKTHRTAADDARTILSARHLVMCHSSFSWCLALMSKNLRTLHQPSSFQIRGVDDFSIYTYEIDNYIKPGEWMATSDQLALMLNHSVDDIRISHMPSSAGGDAGLPQRSHMW